MLRLIHIALLLVVLPCFAFAQDGSEIYLMDNIRYFGLRFGNITNMTNTPGYDNQPCFSADQQYLYFTAIRDGEQSDIYRYNLTSKSITQVTDTKLSEYSPTPIPGSTKLSVVKVEKNKEQRIWSIDPAGKSTEVIAPNVDSVGYFCWIDENRLAVYVLGKKSQLRIVDLKAETETTVATDIGRCIQLIPGTNDISYLQKGSNPWKLCKYDPDTLTTDTIFDWIPYESEDYGWLKEGIIFSGDDGTIHGLDIKRDTAWRVIESFPEPQMARISRWAVSPDGKQFAVVIDEVR